MIWEAFNHDGFRDLQRISGRMNSTQYQAMLYDHLILFGLQTDAANCIFLQENASCHVSKPTLDWFRKEKVNALPWPSRRPDLNSMKKTLEHIMS
ncbi:hypothetical protein AVEN_189140-1 [Araneus ventricosus]|uniref:Tc1-like transposase DDE domain-containing protein n=1 Tax=Araneus ventricosus TaxID=182803 RepID=A0A4Y2JS97_ARAVE|nr:hypothetical protein AVEN_189140-1 [Araneus ventricosus]